MGSDEYWSSCHVVHYGATFICQLPSCNLFTQHVIYHDGETPLVNLWTPVHSFTLTIQSTAIPALSTAIIVLIFFTSPVSLPIKHWWRVDTHVRWETPRGRYEEYSSKFSLSMKPRFNQTSRRKKSLLKVVDSWCWQGALPRYFAPTKQCGCQFHRSCRKQRIGRIVWKMMFVCSE